MLVYGHLATSNYKNEQAACLSTLSSIHGDLLRVLKFLLGSCQCHVETTWVIQEADPLVLIGTHTWQDDEVLLSALEGVYAGNLHLL